MDGIGEVTTIIQDHVQLRAIRPMKSLFNTPIVFFQGFAFPGKNGNTGSGDGRSGLILSGENVAAGPADFGSKFYKCFNQNGGFDSHVETACDFSPFQRLGSSVFFTQCHQSRHFVFRHGDLLSAPFG